MARCDTRLLLKELDYSKNRLADHAGCRGFKCMLRSTKHGLTFPRGSDVVVPDGAVFCQRERRTVGSHQGRVRGLQQAPPTFIETFFFRSFRFVKWMLRSATLYKNKAGGHVCKLLVRGVLQVLLKPHARFINLGNRSATIFQPTVTGWPACLCGACAACGRGLVRCACIGCN